MSGRALSLSLSLCGPGRAGRALVRSWLAAGAEVSDIIARDAGSARAAAQELGAGRARTSHEALGPCDVLVLAVPDDAVSDVAAGLAGRVSARFAYHLAGVLPAAALVPLKPSVGALGSLHPLRAFTGAADETWSGALVAVEGETDAVEQGLALADRLGARGHRVDASGKALYHAGAQLAAGGTAAVVSLAARAWVEAGLDPETARAALGELASGAASAAARRPYAESFTGAVARRDVGTIRAHLDALATLPEVRSVYARLARETLARTPGRGREGEVLGLLADAGC